MPELVVLISWLALGEVPGPLTLVGGALCLAGVAVPGPVGGVRPGRPRSRLRSRRRQGNRSPAGRPAQCERARSARTLMETRAISDSPMM